MSEPPPMSRSTPFFRQYFFGEIFTSCESVVSALARRFCTVTFLTCGALFPRPVSCRDVGHEPLIPLRARRWWPPSPALSYLRESCLCPSFRATHDQCFAWWILFPFRSFPQHSRKLCFLSRRKRHIRRRTPPNQKKPQPTTPTPPTLCLFFSECFLVLTLFVLFQCRDPDA